MNEARKSFAERLRAKPPTHWPNGTAMASQEIAAWSLGYARRDEQAQADDLARCPWEESPDVHRAHAKLMDCIVPYIRADVDIVGVPARMGLACRELLQAVARCR